MVKKAKEFFSTYTLIIVVIFIIISIILLPKESVDAAYKGLMTWFTIVLPALLPFFIGAELLIGLGVVKFIGILLEPLMRPLFNVPGEGSFAYAMSITSGYPVGAKIVSRLRKDKVLSTEEAQRLAAFCSTSGPLFMLGAVGIGMFKSVEIGIFIALCHYLGSISVGLLFRFYKSPALNFYSSTRRNIFSAAFKELKATRSKNPPLGILLGNAVRESLNTLLVVGGFIILFSVIIRVLTTIGIIGILSNFLLFFLKPLGITSSLTNGLLTGIFEITLGSKLVAETFSSWILPKITVAAFIIAWSGLSINAQAISFISTTDISAKIYLFSKFLHGIMAAVFTVILFPFFSSKLQVTKPVFLQYPVLMMKDRFIQSFLFSMEIFIMIILFLLLVASIIAFFNYFKMILNYKKR
ncbi:sporulation integral membrane protein YlbJ [Alkaliphilus serpentinus]|uniref:Sporulation integral membrane protein YlbJ n=1 Tax=Alkaliphilus serpentinus TaxID=1482731 RepID=A0A833HR91_9FIRM|nr:sporulation integral membrane protein YlbJ [Alkaliphilus serpentinus]KAB3533123.1 sporulation integral membrane protein YlbJ [Alkaliphilus serpentinus]